MTGNSNKVRAVFLAALMVFSVFAGTVAFSGATAATTATNASVTPNTVTEQTTNTHTITLNASDIDTTGSTKHNLNVTFPGAVTLGGTATIQNAQFGSDTVSASNAQIQGNNVSVNVTDATGGGASSDTVGVVVQVTSVGAPSVNGDLDADLTFTATEDVDGTPDRDTATTTLTVEEAGNVEVESAVHFDDVSGPGTGVEVTFSEPVDVGSGNDIVLYEDESRVATLGSTPTETQEVFISTSGILRGDLDLEITEGVVDQEGNAIADEGNNSVTFAPVTIANSTSSTQNVYQGGNAAIVANGDDVSVTVEGDDTNYFFEGSTSANSNVFVFNSTNRELDDYNITLGGNGINPSGEPTITVRDLGFGATVEDLNVTTDDEIEVDVTANAGNRPVEFELLDSSGDDINTSDVINTDGAGERTFTFNTATADDGDTLDTGTYTVRVTDLDSGVDVETSEVTVSEADDESAAFADSTIVEQRGDIIEATVELTETDTATLSFGSESDGVIANATVEDNNGDDEVTVYINTYRFLDTAPSDEIYSVDSDSDDEILDQEQPQPSDPIDGTTSDLVDAGDYDLEVQAGEASGVGASSSVGPRITSSDDIATVTLEERSTDTFRTWTGSSEAISSLSDLEDVNEALNEGQITQSSDIAAGDIIVHQLVASGFEGVLDAREDEDVTNAFASIDGRSSGPIELTIEEASPGANQDAKEVVKGYGNNVSVVADGPNDTYFVVVDTGQGINLADDDATGQNAESLPSDEDTELEANFTVFGDEDGTTWDFTTNEDDENEETFVEYTVEEPDVNVDEPFNVSQASGQTISGTTNIAPGTEISLRVRSDDGVSPSFLKTANPVVQSDGTFSSTFDFSEQNVGDTYTIRISSSNIILADDVEEDGEVVEAVATDTATPEPDTDTATPEPDTATPEPDTDTPEPDTDTATPMPDTDTPTSTPTSTPGFGVVVALTALLAAALLAVRRD